MNRPIIALDFPNWETTAAFLNKFPKTEELYVKVGMELFYREGPELIKKIQSAGHAIFLDLKLHDIPNTVQRAMTNLAALGIAMTNVHAAGGSAMMKAAKTGLVAGTPAGQPVPTLLAVTQLTSTSEKMMQQEQLVTASLTESVCHYAELTETAGLDGVVCSALEVEQIREVTNSNFVCLTPGIRPKGSSQDDQKRIVTPAQAAKLGSTYIVVGRPITQAADPVAMYEQVKKEWNGER